MRNMLDLSYSCSWSVESTPSVLNTTFPTPWDSGMVRASVRVGVKVGVRVRVRVWVIGTHATPEQDNGDK